MADDTRRESAQRALIEAHIAEGSWGEAQRTFRSYCHLLGRELGMMPGFDLATLIRPTPGPECHPGMRTWKRDAEQWAPIAFPAEVGQR